MSKIDDWLKPGAIVPVNVETTKELVDALREAMKPKAIYHGGPAFPTHLNLTRGMTLRDYFASHCPPMPEQWFNDSPRKKSDPLWHWGEASAAWAYYYADAMLKAREE